MNPKSPVIEGREAEEVALGKSQPEFQTLPTIFFRDDEGRKALSRWEPDAAELEELNRTRSLYLSQICGDRAPNAILPSVFPPEIPEQVAEPEAVEPASASAPVMFEFRLVPLDRATGNPRGSVETGARVFLDLTALAIQFAAAGGVTSDPTEIIDRQLDSFARVLANAYGADVYFRLYDGTPGGWKFVEGRLESGAHERRTVRAGLTMLPDAVEVAALDFDGRATVAEAVRMMKELRNRFAPPFRLLGRSPSDAPAAIQAFGEVVSSTELLTIPDLVTCFRKFKPEGDFCLLISADGRDDESKRGVFLLDLRLFEKSRSN